MQQYIEKLAKAAFEEGAHDVPSDAAKDMGYSPIHAAIVKAGPPPRKS